METSCAQCAKSGEKTANGWRPSAAGKRTGIRPKGRRNAIVTGLPAVYLLVSVRLRAKRANALFARETLSKNAGKRS
jgi:hypothetical protein